MSRDLTERERQILDFAGRWYRYAGKQEQDIRDLFGCSATRYWLSLNQLLEEPAALAYAPATVNRYRRVRAEKQAARSLRRLGS